MCITHTLAVIALASLSLSAQADAFSDGGYNYYQEQGYYAARTPTPPTPVSSELHTMTGSSRTPTSEAGTAMATVSTRKKLLSHVVFQSNRVYVR